MKACLFEYLFYTSIWSLNSCLAGCTSSCAYLNGGKPCLKMFALQKVPQVNFAVGAGASVAHNGINFSVVFEDALLEGNSLYSMWSIHSSVNEKC